MKIALSGVDIHSVVGVVPRHVSYFDDEVSNYPQDSGSSAKLKRLMGYGEHRIENSGRAVSDYACVALERLFEQGAVQREEIDALIVVTQTPDFLIPPTSCVIHGRLGLPRATYVVDINDGCAGYVKGIGEAAMILSSSSARVAVVVAGDVLSPRVSRRDRNSYPLVGDAVTATVIRKASKEQGIELMIEANGTGWDALMIPAGGMRAPSSDKTREFTSDSDGNVRNQEQLVMKGGDVFAFTQTVVPEFIGRFLSQSGRTVDSFDRFYLHQANAFILDKLRRKIGVDEVTLPDRVIRRYGNSSSGTIPMLIASEPEARELQCLLVGFGVGLEWGAASCALKAGQFREVMEF